MRLLQKNHWAIDCLRKMFGADSLSKRRRALAAISHEAGLGTGMDCDGSKENKGLADRAVHAPPIATGFRDYRTGPSAKSAM